MRTIYIKQRKSKSKYVLVYFIGLFLSWITLELIGAFNLEWKVKAGYPYTEFEAIRDVEQMEGQEVGRMVEEIIPIRNQGWELYLESLQIGEAEEWVKRVVHCESRGNPLSVNSQEITIDGISYGRATGLGQFLPGTWNRCEKYLGKDLDIFNEYNQIDCMLKFYKLGQQHEWACK